MSVVTQNALVSRSPLAVSSEANRYRYFQCAIAFALLAFAATFIDLPLSKLVLAQSAESKHWLPSDVRKFITLNEFFGHGLSVALILLTVTVLDRANRVRLPALLMFTYGAGLAADCVKFSVARIRPLRFSMDLAIYDSFVGFFPKLWKPTETALSGWAIQSFPSGHTATAVGLAIGLSRLYPAGRWLFALFATLLAIQRSDAGAHWLSDTCGGAGVAFLWAAISERIEERIRAKRSL